MSELKACPNLLCGGTNIDVDPDHDYETKDPIVECMDCGVRAELKKWQAPRPSENKIKAEGIMEAIKQCSPLPIGSPDDFSEGYNGYCEALCALQEYANKLEKGE